MYLSTFCKYTMLYVHYVCVQYICIPTSLAYLQHHKPQNSNSTPNKMIFIHSLKLILYLLEKRLPSQKGK